MPHIMRNAIRDAPRCLTRRYSAHGEPEHGRFAGHAGQPAGPHPRPATTRTPGRKFVQLYRRWCTDSPGVSGLQDADAADLMQDVLAASPPRRQARVRPAPGHVPRLAVHRHPEQAFTPASTAAEQVQAAGDSDGQERLDRQPARRRRPAADWEQEYQQRHLRAGRWSGSAGEFQRRDLAGVLADGRGGQGPQEVADQLRTVARGGLRRQEPGAGPAADRGAAVEG